MSNGRKRIFISSVQREEAQARAQEAQADGSIWRQAVARLPVKASQLSNLQDECDQLIAIFTSIAKKAKASLPS